MTVNKEYKNGRFIVKKTTLAELIEQGIVIKLKEKDNKELI